MSDNVPLYTQRVCSSEIYNLDVFSYVQPPVFGTQGSCNQVIVYVTRAKDSGRQAFFQEQKSLGMMEVYSNSFLWKTTQGGTLTAKLVMGDIRSSIEVLSLSTTWPMSSCKNPIGNLSTSSRAPFLPSEVVVVLILWVGSINYKIISSS